MSKKVQIILKKTCHPLGNKNFIVNVAQGYALNYLIPNNLAEIATKGKIKHIKMMQSIEKSKLATEQNNAIILQNYLQEILKITLKKKTGDKHQIFGSINDKDIITKISSLTGMNLEKKKIHLPEIKSIGIYSIKIEISSNIYIILKLQILPSEVKINI